MSLSLESLVAETDPQTRARLCADYIAAGNAALASARKLRDEAIITLLASGERPSVVARGCGVSIAHVRLVQRLRKAAA